MQYRISGLGLLSLAASTVLAMPHHHANQHAQLHDRQMRRDVNEASYAMGNSSALYAPTGGIPPAEASTLRLTQTMDVTEYYTQTNKGNLHHASAAAAAAAAASSPASVAAAEASGNVCYENNVTVTVTPAAVTVTVTASSEESSSAAAVVSTPAYVAPSSAIPVYVTPSSAVASSAVEAATSTPAYVAPSSAVVSSAAEAATSTPAYVAPSSVEVSSVAAVTSSVEISLPTYVAPLTSAVAGASSYISSTLVSSTVEVSAAASSTASRSSSDVSKKGLVYNDVTVVKEFISSGTVGWAWNWGATPDGDLPSSIEYVPCIQNTEGIDSWSSNAKTQIEAGSTALMSFNEPDVLPADGGSNLTPAKAAEYYKSTMNSFASQAKLVSPSVCNGNGIRSDTGVVQGLDWLLEFMSEENCGSCNVDYYAIHWYETLTEQNDLDACVEGFKNHIWNATNIWNGDSSKTKPLWITEFALSGADDATEAKFLETVIAWMGESNQSYIDRYSYFKADTLVSATSLLTAYSS